MDCAITKSLSCIADRFDKFYFNHRKAKSTELNKPILPFQTVVHVSNLQTIFSQQKLKESFLLQLKY